MCQVRNSSCVAVFTDIEHAIQALDLLNEYSFDSEQIELLGKKIEPDANHSIPYSINTQWPEALDGNGIPESQLHCYQCLIHGGSYLVIVSGSYDFIENACGLLEQLKEATVAIHLNNTDTKQEGKYNEY